METTPRSQKKEDKIYLTLVFTLPTISPKTSPRKAPLNTSNNSYSKKASVNQTRNYSLQKSKILLRENIVDNSAKKNNHNKIENYFKERFYEDIEDNINARLKRKKMFDDKLLQNRVIHMKKVIGFWKCFCDYTNPIFSIQKFKNSQLLMKKKENNLYKSSDNYKPKNSVLYTNNSVNEMHHKQKRLNEINFYKKLQKKRKINIFK